MTCLKESTGAMAIHQVKVWNCKSPPRNYYYFLYLTLHYFPYAPAIPPLPSLTTQRIPHPHSPPLQKPNKTPPPPLISLNITFFFFSFILFKTLLTNFPLISLKMESNVASTSSLSNHHQLHHRFRPSQPVADRIVRALRHRLRLLHRSESNFFILGATGNVYTVILTTTPSCTCPDRTTPCKHILFVLIRVLGVSLDDTSLRRRTLRPCQLSRLLATPTLPEAVAGGGVRERFHQLFFQTRQGVLRPRIEIEEGTTCPVCLEEMEKGEKVVACGTCRNAIHEECLMRWKRSRGKRSASCVICRARWRDRNDQDKYLNLAAYVSEEDAADQGVGLCAG